MSWVIVTMFITASEAADLHWPRAGGSGEGNLHWLCTVSDQIPNTCIIDGTVTHVVYHCGCYTDF